MELPIGMGTKGKTDWSGFDGYAVARIGQVPPRSAQIRPLVLRNLGFDEAAKELAVDWQYRAVQQWP